MRKDKRGGTLDYNEGELLGNNNHIFIKEVEPRTYKIKGYERNIRRALFKCGLCGCELENSIQLIKTNKVKSCGCFQRTSVKEYFRSKNEPK